MDSFAAENVYSVPSVYLSVFHHEASDIYYHLTVTSQGALKVFQVGQITPVADLTLDREIRAVKVTTMEVCCHMK